MLQVQALLLTTFLAAAGGSSAAERCIPFLVAAEPGTNLVLYRGASPDGHKLAIGWDRREGERIARGAMLLDLRSGERSELPGLNNEPSFSPDGRFVVSANYVDAPRRHTEVTELELASRATRVYAAADSNEWLPSYSRDGDWIVFNSTRSGTSDVFRAQRRDGAIERLTDDARYEAHATFVDRDRAIVFHRQTDGDDYDIVRKDLATKAETPLAATALVEAYPAISPDERWIAYSSAAAAGAQPNLYLAPLAGGERRRLTEGADKDAYAAWSPDGRTIYFVRFEPGASKVFGLHVANGACTATSAAHSATVAHEGSERESPA
jgi:Tol biopolymer transport system component